MKACDIRQLGVDELRGKVRQWEDEAFRNRFKAQAAETKDTSLMRKTRRNIARAKTILGEKLKAQGSATNARE